MRMQILDANGFGRSFGFHLLSAIVTIIGVRTREGIYILFNCNIVKCITIYLTKHHYKIYSFFIVIHVYYFYWIKENSELIMSRSRNCTMHRRSFRELFDNSIHGSCIRADIGIRQGTYRIKGEFHESNYFMSVADQLEKNKRVPGEPPSSLTLLVNDVPSATSNPDAGFNDGFCSLAACAN